MPTLLHFTEAADRAGMNPGHVARLCRDKYGPAGLAVKRSTGHGKPAWHVNESADPAFSRVKSPEQIGTDLSHLTEKKRREAFMRLDLIKRWEAALAGRWEIGFSEKQVTGQFILTAQAKDGMPLSRSKLYAWRERWRMGGLAALADQRGLESETLPADERMWDLIKGLWLNLRKPSLQSCYDIAVYEAEKSGWAQSSYQTMHRRISEIPQAVVDKLRNGKEEFVKNSAPYNERDYSTIHSNEIFCGDHHQFDVICRNAKGEHFRPWITAWQDVRSRKIVGWRIFQHAPNSDTILLAMRDAVTGYGVPTNVLIDNGKDYDCYSLNGRTKKERWHKTKLRIDYDGPYIRGLFGGLGVEVTHCLPYHGQSKPIERWFGTLESQFGKLWPTYCGRATHEKPENLQLQLERGNAPTIEHFIEQFGRYLATFHASAHSGNGMDGRSPDAVYAASWGNHSRRTTTDEMLWYLTLKVSRPVKVGQNGVEYLRMKYGRNNPWLIQRIGEEVILRADPMRVNEIIVCDLAGKPICIAKSNDQLPFLTQAEELKAAQRENTSVNQMVKKYHRVRPSIQRSLADRTIAARAEKIAREAAANPEPTPQPPTIAPVRSPFESDVKALRDEIKQPLRLAVGAESMSEPRESRFLYAAQKQAAETAEAEPDRAPTFREMMASQTSNEVEE